MSLNANSGQTPKKNKQDDGLKLINSPADQPEDLYEFLINVPPPKKLFQVDSQLWSRISEEQQYSSEMIPEQSESQNTPEEKEKQKIQKKVQQNQYTIKKMATPIKAAKGCNCQKSHCLKKYCDCFKVGQVCSDGCSCVGCQNTEITEQHFKQIKILEMTRSGKGGKELKCNCQKSHCLKNYCQCHSAGRTCSSTCNCFECQNKIGSTIKSRKRRHFLEVSQWSGKKSSKQNVLFN